MWALQNRLSQKYVNAFVPGGVEYGAPYVFAERDEAQKRLGFLPKEMRADFEVADASPAALGPLWSQKLVGTPGGEIGLSSKTEALEAHLRAAIAPATEGAPDGPAPAPAVPAPAPVPVPAGGLKYDDGKLPLQLLPDDALDEVAKVLQFGAKKYAARNWEKGIVFDRLYRAARGHLKDWFLHRVFGRSDRDSETGLSHLAHAACCVLFLLAFEVRGRTELDNRPDGRGG